MSENLGNTKKRERISMILYVLYLFLLLGSAVLVARIIGIQVFFHPDEKIQEALTPAVETKTIDPARGNIYDCEGRLLALSAPIYQVYMDCTVLKKDIKAKMDSRIAKADGDPLKVAAAKEEAERREADWLAKAKELSVELARVFPDHNADHYYQLIKEGRENNRKYVKIGTPVDRNLRNEILEFPLFRDGRYRSGLIIEQDYIRKYPYGKLARRTIGFVRNNKSNVGNTHIGLEGKFDHILHGTNGKEYLRVTDHGRMRDNDSTFVKAIDGLNLRTTINIDYQEIADKALREQIEVEEDLDGACLVLMEVGTGAIRAMVNLVRNQQSGTFEEIQNLAIGRKCEPGSVFKTVTLMSVLNDGFITSLEETLPTGSGHVEGTSINDPHIPDFVHSHGGVHEISIIDGFRISSNYVFATLAVKNYGKHGTTDNTRRFLQNIYTYKLGEAYDFDLDGMLTPTIPSPDTRYWTNTDLGSIGFGYSTEETPMHILTFYNAIANKGKMMKPYLVESIDDVNGKTVDKRGPSILNSAVCTKAVADTITRALIAVTEEGTAKRLKSAKCTVAGKTGTSFGTFDNGQYSDAQGRKKYQGTFVGFFPAEDPQYSVICAVYSKPTNKQFQGGGIPARAIKTLIDGLYCMDPYFRPQLEKAK